MAVADCETDPFVHGRVPKPFAWGYYDGNLYRSFRDTGDFVSFLQTQNAIVYAHNGGRFDWHYILPFVPAFTDFLVINGRIVKFKFGKAELRDSFSILPVALAEYQKTQIDYSWFEPRERKKHIADIMAYLQDDCIFLYELVTQFIEKYGQAVTLASAAFKQFSSIQPFERDLVTTGRNKLLHEFVSPFYYGGRTQAFETGIFKGKFHVWDINSAYPFAMSQEHPAGTEYTVRGPDCIAKVSPQTFYNVDATSFGAFPLRDGIKLKFPVGERHIYNVTGWELLAGMETQTVKIHDIIKRIAFHETVNFSDYVTHFWNLKKAAKRGTPEYIYAKLFLNSLYGKLAANPERYNKYMSVPADCVLAAERDEWSFVGYLPSEDALVSKPLPEPARHYYNMASAASITGFVRAVLWRQICSLRAQGHRVLYCDTDSLLTDGFVSHPGSDLGQWKLELDPMLCAIAGRKLYALRYQDASGIHWKTASKGAQLSSREILRIASGGAVTYRAAAPTFSLTGKPTFIDRKIVATA